MDYVTFNIEKIHNMTSLRARSIHNQMKKLDGSEHIPASHDNLQFLHRNKHDSRPNYKNAYTATQLLLKKYPMEKNNEYQVPAVELVLGASSEFHKGMSEEDEQKYFKDQLAWAKQYYKKDGMLLQADIHYTEDTPHMHLIFAPLRERITYQTQPKRDAAGNKIEKKSNNKKAQVRYERENVLDDQGNPLIKKRKMSWSANAFQGNKVKMAKARDSQAEFMQAKGWDLERGKSHYFDFISGKTTKEEYYQNRKNSDDRRNCTKWKQAESDRLDRKIDASKIIINDAMPNLADIFDHHFQDIQVKKIINNPK
jgi:hypothetical protein